MSDLRSRLERIGDRVRPRPDSFERLQRVRRRRTRNRRIGAGVVALAVALAGSLTWVVALRDGGPRAAGNGDGAPAHDDEMVPEIGEVVCDGTTTTVLTERVAARPDGVHLRVTNTSSIDLSLQFEGVGGDNAGVGEHEVVWPLAPGPVRVRCLDPALDAGSPDGYEVLEVVDPSGLFVSPELACSVVSEMIPEYKEGAVGEPGDPVSATRARLAGLLDGDVLEQAGYPEAREPIVRVLRDGVVIARVVLRSNSGDGWLLASLTACDESDTRFGWSEEPLVPHPNGWFRWCPATPFAQPGPDWRAQASEVATQFALAYVNGPEEDLRPFLDESVPPDATFPEISLAEDVVTTFGVASGGGILVDFSCGAEVAAHTVRVTIDDGTESASADFTLFLVPREDGWKVWGVY